jgi:putative tricarboxylic transport membrane protein
VSSTRRDLACAVLLFALAVGYYVAASRIGQTALSDAVGPTGLPRVYAAALAALAAAIGTTALLRHRLGRTAEPGPNEPETPGLEASGPAALRRLMRGAGAVAIGVVYLAIVNVIGYPFAMAIMIGAMAVYQGERPSLRVAVVAAAGAAALYVLFDVVLGVTMPAPWNG